MKRSPDIDSRTPRLLLVTIDWLPAWMLPAYGATWVSAPHLDTLAARGVVFDRVLAPSTCPAATRSAILSAFDDSDRAGRSAATTVAGAVELIREGRHPLVACHLDRLGRSWEAPHELRERYRDPEDPPSMEGSEPPRFANDSETDPDRLTVVRQAFAAEVTAVDLEIGRLLGAVADSPHRWRVCVAGTGGMPLGLHGQVGIPMPDARSILPYSERVHLPVILHDPDGRMAGQRFPGLVGAGDIGATLGEWLDLEAGPHRRDARSPRDDEGPRSLASLFDSWNAMPRERLLIRGRGGAGVATPAWHLVASWPEGREAGVTASLYAKPDDWFEVSDVADRCPAETEELLRECLEHPDLAG